MFPDDNTADEFCGSGSESGPIARASPVPPRSAPPQTGKSGSCLCPSQCFPCFPSPSRFPLKGGISSKLGKVKGAETSPVTGRQEADGGHGAWGGGGATLPSCPSPLLPSPHSARPALLVSRCVCECKSMVCVCMHTEHTCAAGIGGGLLNLQG